MGSWPKGRVRGRRGRITWLYISVGLHGQYTVSDTVQNQKAESDKSCINSCERGEGTRNKKNKGWRERKKRLREREEATGDKSYL
jgi:hypothetical protein